MSKSISSLVQYPGLSCVYGITTSLGFIPLDTSDTLSLLPCWSCDHPKWLQTLSDVLWEEKWLLVKKHCYMKTPRVLGAPQSLPASRTGHGTWLVLSDPMNERACTNWVDDTSVHILFGRTTIHPGFPKTSLVYTNISGKENPFHTQKCPSLNNKLYAHTKFNYSCTLPCLPRTRWSHFPVSQ